VFLRKSADPIYDGSLEIDNNWEENAIRPNTLGRIIYLFAGSYEGAMQASMFLYFYCMCTMNNLNPTAWHRKVLQVIPDYPANKLTHLFSQNLQLSLAMAWV